MQIVIDISEEDYKKATDHLRIFNEKALKEDFMNATLRDRLEIALLHGNILPQGHGRLMDDLISRQDAIDAIVTWTVEDRPHEVMPTDLVDRVNALPSAERKGKWIDEGQYAEGHSEHAYHCSECEEHYIGWIGEFNFCPNCGADMRGREK